MPSLKVTKLLFSLFFYRFNDDEIIMNKVSIIYDNILPINSIL